MDRVEVEQIWTFESVEGRLVEAMRLWWRAPGGGTWPFATDAPWHMMRRVNQRGDGFEFYDPRGFDMKSSEVALRPLPLVREEIARRDEASAWLEQYVPERDRRLVSLALQVKASGRSVKWRRLLAPMGMEYGAEGLRKRYSRALTVVAKALDKAAVPVVFADAQ